MIGALACAVAEQPDAPVAKIRTQEWNRLTKAANGDREARATARVALLRRLGRSQGTGDTVAVDVVEILDVLGDIAAKWTVDAAYSGANPVWKRWIESLGAALRGVGAEWTARVEWARDLGDHLGVADDRSLAAIADEVEATSTVLDQVVGQQDDPNVLLALREMRRLSDADVRAMIAEFDSAAAPSWPEQFRRVAGLDEQLAEKTTIAVRMINSYLEDAESAVDEKQESGGSASALEKARAVLVESIDSFDAALEAIDG